MGDATSGSRITRAGTRRTAPRRRAVGTRDRVIAHLARVTDIADRTGMASTKLAEAIGYPGSSVAFAQLLSGMERDGLITREVRGKRTYRITLSADAADSRPAAPKRPAAAAPAGADWHAEADEPAAANATRIAPAGPPAEFDYDELARRLLIQVVRRLTAPQDDLERTVAGLQRELATAWTRHGTLTAENVRLREQLIQTQRDLDLARQRTGKQAVADELNQAEIVLLERLLALDRGSADEQSGDRVN